jgi:hypothetical protein
MKGSVKAFAIFKIGDFSGTNDRLLDHLRRPVPDPDADAIDVVDFKPFNRSDAARLAR